MLQATCDHKKGNLAPGMADVIEVEFCPQEFRYYYDCVRIHSEVRAQHSVRVGAGCCRACHAETQLSRSWDGAAGCMVWHIFNSMRQWTGSYSSTF